MIGRLEPKSKDVLVVGAGISGLLVSYFLDRAGYRVTLVEAAHRGGGLIATTQSPYGIVEAAAHSIPATPTVRELFSDLGLELCAIRDASKARFIYRAGKFRKFPLGPLEVLGAFFRAYFMRASKVDPESLTLEDWTRRFLGEAVLKYLMTPFVRGIYGAEPRDISVSAAFPALCVPRGHSLLSFFLAKKIRKNPPKGVKRALPRIPRGEISAPLHGMQSLTDALENRLSLRLGDRFRKNHKIESLKEEASNLLLCVPAAEAGELLAAEAPELSSMLRQIRYSPLTTATIFAEKKSFEREPKGLGVLIPAGEGRRCLGVLYNSSAYPGRVKSDDCVSLTMMLDDSASADQIPGVIQEELEALFGMKNPPLETVVRRWKRAVPKYDAHLLKTWELAEESWCAEPGRILFGNYTGQVSIRGMAELARALSRTGSTR